MMLTNSQIRVKLFESLKNSFMKKSVIISFILFFILLITAFAVIVDRFEFKLKLNEQKDLITKNIRLDEQWSQILLEYSTLATSTSVENYADEVGMSLPTQKTIRFLSEDVGDKATNATGGVR